MIALILIDTSAWVEALRQTGDPVVCGKVREAVLQGGARLCEIVLLELWNGARGIGERAMLRQLEREVEMLPLTPDVWRTANNLAVACRGAGITAPATDVVIAACASYYDAQLLHRDSDFDQIAKAGRAKGSGKRS